MAQGQLSFKSKHVIMPNLLLGVPSYDYLTTEVSADLAIELAELEYRHFLDGERYLRIVSSVRDRDILLIGGTVSDQNTLDLYDIASGVVAGGCRSLTMFIPFFGYSTMERAVKPGEIVTAKTRAKLLSSIPRAPYGNHFILLDLHTGGLPYYFEESLTPVHLYAKSIVLRQARLFGGDNFSIACVDAGRAKWVESLANDLGVEASFVFKRRLGDAKTEVLASSASVSGKNVIIYDDMIRSGSSIFKAAQAYKQAGAKEISLIATHGVFTGNCLTTLQSSGLIKRVVTTNSHPGALAQPPMGDFLKVVSVTELLAAFLRG